MWVFRTIIVTLIYIGINVFSGIRLFNFIKYFFPFSKALAFWPVYIFISYLFILVMLIRIKGVQPFPFTVRQAGMYSLPLYVYFFMALLLIEVLRLALQYFGCIPNSQVISVAATGIALALAVFSMVYGTLNAMHIRTAHYDISISKNFSGVKANGLRIALVSDLHIGGAVSRKWVARIVDAVNRTEPDIIVMAGDIFDNSVSAIRDPEGVVAELLRLRAPLGVFASGGNHDVDRLAWGEEASTDGINNFLKRAGIIFLQDEYDLIKDSFYIVGRRDIRPIGLNHTRKTTDELISDLDKSRLIIFLDHQPLDFPAMDEAGADLILSGHTHKGQFFPGNFFTERIFRKAGSVHYGYWKGRFAQGVITSGAGVWGPSIRIASNSEVVMVNLNGPGTGSLP